MVQFLNVNRAQIRGIETLAQTSLWKKRLTATLSYTWLDPIDKITNETLAYRPKSYFTSNINLNLDFFNIGIDYRFVSRLEKVSVYPNDDRVAQKVFIERR